MKSFKRLISFVSSMAIAVTSIGLTPIGALAAGEADDENISVVKPTYDITLRYNNTNPSATDGKMEIRTGVENDANVDFLGMMRYEIPETPAGYHIGSAELKLVTERRKASSTKVGIYKIDTGDKWTTEKINYEDLSDEITAARAADPLFEFVPNGVNDKAITDSFTNADYMTVDAWTNNIPISGDEITEGYFDFIISQNPSDTNVKQTCFYTKDQTADIVIGQNPENTLTGEAVEAVHPTLTIKYAPDAIATEEPTATPTVKPTDEPTATPTVKPTDEPTATPTVEPTDAPTATPTVEPTDAPTATPTVKPTDAPTATPTAEPAETTAPTVEPTTKPTAVPLPDGAIVVKDRLSNVTTTQTITVDEYGNKRDAAYTTNNSSIWYIGNYDISKIKSIDLRLGMVGKYTDGELTATPIVKLAYMNVESDTVIDSEYIAANSSEIRSTPNRIAQIEGLTEPEAHQTEGHLYLGAVYTVTPTSVVVDTAGYAKFPGGKAVLGANNTTPLDTKKTSGEVAVFVYATAQNCRAAIDYITVTKDTDEELTTPEPTGKPIPTATPTAQPTDETPTPTVKPTDAPTATPTVKPTDAPTAKPSDLKYNKFDMARASLIRYNIADKSKHTVENGKSVAIVDATTEKGNDRKFIDGDTASVFTSGQTSNCAVAIDLGVTIPISRIVVKGVSQSAIIGLAGDEGNVNGVLTDTSLTLSRNWARLNNSATKNLTSDISVTYGTLDGVYDTVTLDGAFGDARYIVFDGNGSSSKCAEIEVYYDGDVLPEPTEAPTPGPTETPDPTKPTPTPSPTPIPDTSDIPDGAIIVKDQPSTGTASTQSATVNSSGAKRDVAYSNGTGVWYLGTYELANIDKIDLRLGLVAAEDGTLPQVRIGYVPADGKTVDNDYVTANSSAIRATSNRLAVIEGETKPTSNAAQGHLWLGALYTVTETSVTVDSEGYSVFPGGTASLGPNLEPLNTAVSGKVNLFVYTVAGKCRATIDYAVVTEKVLTPTELKIDGSDTWVIRDNVAADYTTAADAYKAVLISDLGTEMKINEGEVTWSVTGSDYIGMTSPSGANSAMTAEKDLPIGSHTITLVAEYENNDGITLRAEKTITVDKRESSVPKTITVSGESSLDLLASQLPYTQNYTAAVYDQFETEMEDAVIAWNVTGNNINGYSIADGVLTVGEDAESAQITIIASSVANPDVKAEFTVDVTISLYPSKLYPTADVLFRMDNTDTKNVSGPEIEIKNLAESDRGFSGGLKFDISTLKSAIEAGYPINSIKIRLTSSLSKDGKLMMKPLSNDWDESSAVTNSFENKVDIINRAINSEESVVSNDDEGVFTLARMTNGKRMYEGERGDTETVESWQTTLDIEEYIRKYIENNPIADTVSFLIMPYYNGTNQNIIFSKDVNSETYTNWSALTTKFPELEKTPELLYPAILVDYAEETVTITAKVDSIPIPSNDNANSTQLSAVHYNPFTEQNDSDIIWTITGFEGEDGGASASGITISDSGVLTVTKSAKPGVVTIRAAARSNPIIYSEKKIEITALASQLLNGSFENTNDSMMPRSWTSYDPDIDAAHNGVQGYQMDQASENALTNFMETNDTDGYLAGTHSAEDPTGLYGKKTVKITGSHGIDKDYEGKIYTSNAANNNSDGGPDLRVTTGVSYWILQDYHLEEFYQLNPSNLVGPYVGYEGFQGTTSKSTQCSGNWYIKDGSASQAYTTNGYDTLIKQVTIPQNVTRLRINWGLTGSEGSVYFHNFRLAPQGIDTSKTAVDGSNTLKVTGKMTWTSAGIAVTPGKDYTYKFSNMSESAASGLATIKFLDAEGNEIQSERTEVEYSNKWVAKTGRVIAPDGAAYAEMVLANGTGSGSTWYDNVILTETTESVATYASITEGNSLVVSPLAGEAANTYTYKAEIKDQYNEPYESAIAWSLAESYAGITIDGNGTLTVSDKAEAGTITIIAAAAENSSAYAEKKVTVVKKAESSQEVTLQNGDFSSYDNTTLLPENWTDSDKELSTANGSFDSSISGWKYNSTTYTNSDTSPEFTWDSEIDHTGNSGGSAKIYNADRAQGSMQISQNLDIQGGNTYEISVWVKTDHVSEDSNVFASLIFLNEDNGTIEENKNLLVFYPTGDSYGNNTSDWTKLSGRIFANQLAKRLRIDLRYRGGANNKNGTVWFDDLVITKLAGMDADVEYNNRPSLSLTGYGAENDDVSRTYGEKWDSDPIIGITAGQQYVYSANVQSFNAPKGAYLMLTYYDAAGRAIGSDKTAYVSGTNRTWQEVTGVSVAPLNSSYAVMSLCIDSTGTAWFADASFKADSTVTQPPTVKPTDKPSNPSGGGGGGGGGGSGSSGSKETQSGSTGSTASGGAMGNFGNALGQVTGSNDDTVTTTPESLLPQPDVTYFSQNIGVIAGFTDINDVVWAQKAIVAMNAAGIVNGKTDTLFAPNDNITRAEFVKLLIGMLDYANKIDTDGAKCSFTDVAEDAWYYDAVAAAVMNGIVTGVTDTEFAPDAQITRQDMAVMLSRAANTAKLTLRNGAELVFTDNSDISDYAADAVRSMSKAGIINGFDDGTFAPKDNATRAQAVVMIYRLAGGTD